MKSRQTFLSSGRGGRPARRRSLEVALLEDRVLLADTTVPTTAAAVVGQLGNSGIYVSPVTVNLSATDPDDVPSTLTTRFSINGGPFLNGNTVNLTSDGFFTIQFRSTDPAGNVEATKTLALKIDRSAPTTAAAVVGQLGNNGIYVSPVTVNLTATDPDDSPSTLTTQFSVNGGPFQNGNAVNLTSDGIFTIQFRSTDPAGNVEATKTLTLEIDRTAPTLRLTANPATLWPPNGKSATIQVSGVATDNLSGVDSPLNFRVRDEYGKVQPSGQATVRPDGRFNFSVQLVSSRLGQDKNGRQYTLFVTVQDEAGNRTTRSVVITVPHDQGHHNGGGKGGKHGDDDQGEGSHGKGHGIAQNHDDPPRFDHKSSKDKHAKKGASKGKGRG